MNLNSTPRLRERLRQAARQAILEAAEKVFAEDGLQRARMEDIASAAGVAVGTLYNHFRDRDALLAALLDARREELSERLDAALSEHPRTPVRPRFEAFIHAALEHFETHRVLWAVVIEEELHRRRPPRARPLLAEISSRAERLVRDAVKDRALRPEDAELYPAFLAGVLRAVVRRSLLDGAPLAAEAPKVARFFFEGAQAR